MKKLLLSLPFLLAACNSSEELSFPIANSSESAAAPEAVNFSTYMGRGKATRAGANGTINTDVLKKTNYGFGVFAYQTGTVNYSAYRTQNDAEKHYPNFMFNERIIWDETKSKWVYADVKNTKYWPNELAGVGAVDDQNNDSGNDPATTVNSNGGKVSFFAYAPYAAEASTDNVDGIEGRTVSATDNDGTNSGIIAFSGNLFNGGKSDATDVNERYQFSDPYLVYRLSSDNDKQVDLLWATTTGSSPTVTSSDATALQMGVAADSYADFTTGGTAIVNNLASDPQVIVRPQFNVAADLTKQKTQGTVNLLFKHALAKIGGSYVGTGDGSDNDPATATNGLLVVLDIDNEQGEETGGSLQPYAETPTATTPHNTKVTINSIVLESEKQLTDAGKTAIENNTTFDYESTDYTTTLYNTGIFNLVTGVWHGQSLTPATATSTTRTQTIVPSGADFDGSTDDALKDAVLNANLAEPLTHPGYTKEGFESLPIGVTTVVKNVYADKGDAQPFVFIPGTHPIITITIDYTVRTYDAKLANKFSEVRQKITKRLYILDEIQLNKQYNIVMHLGLTSVKFTATVDDWDATPATQTDNTDPTNPVTTYTEDVEHVYLPINVKEN